jgi:hypothetical protein
MDDSQVFDRTAYRQYLIDDALANRRAPGML